jgi:hypothetical protein
MQCGAAAGKEQAPDDRSAESRMTALCASRDVFAVRNRAMLRRKILPKSEADCFLLVMASLEPSQNVTFLQLPESDCVKKAETWRVWRRGPFFPFFASSIVETSDVPC